MVQHYEMARGYLITLLLQEQLCDAGYDSGERRVNPETNRRQVWKAREVPVLAPKILTLKEKYNRALKKIVELEAELIQKKKSTILLWNYEK